MRNQTYILNAIGHFDVAGPDIGQLKTFYEGVFGWTAESQGPGYSLLKTPEGGVDGALIDADEPSLRVGVVVPDLDRALAKATALGGSIVMPVTDNGWVKKGQVADPAGNMLTLIQG